MLAWRGAGRYKPRKEAEMAALDAVKGMNPDDLPRGVPIGTVELWNCTGSDGDCH
jgi:hypothetical protein